MSPKTTSNNADTPPQSPYHFNFNPEEHSTAAQVVQLVGKNKKILELGCAYGDMTKAFVEFNHCQVTGIEIDPESAESARPFCEKLHICNIDTVDWESVLGDARFDVIVAADVIEHLLHPVQCLKNMTRFLMPNGYIVLSVPNMTHNGIIAELVTENFEYRNVGLLDRTHLRFFGWKSLEKALDQAGLGVLDIHRMHRPPEKTEFNEVWSRLPEWFSYSLNLRVEGNVYQYIIKAGLKETVLNKKCYKAPAYGKFSLTLDDMIKAARLKAEKEKQEALAKRNSALAQRDLAFAERDSAFAERGSAFAERDLAIAERNGTISEKNSIDASRKQLAAELQQAIVSHDQTRELLNEVLSSRSWRITSPIRFMTRTFQHGLLPEDRNRLGQILRKGYHRLPIPFFLKNRISQFYHNRIRPSYHAAISPETKQPFEIPSTGLADQELNCPDYFVWSVIDWHFRQQRPQHLARLIAGTKRRVFYISTIFEADARSGFSVEPLDETGRLFEIKLYLKSVISIFTSAPGKTVRQQLIEDLGTLLRWTDSQQSISLIQHPFWYEVASVLPNCRIVYDCMDHHEGFGNTARDILTLEEKLFKNADLTISTSSWLNETISAHSPNHHIVRNAGDYNHFSACPTQTYRDERGRKIIGYFGAIAEWFDQELIEAVAKKFSDSLIILIGADTVNAKRRLGKYNNIKFTGELPYNKLPYYLHGFDVCLLPFKVTNLTLATNPVKIYEYLSAGKNVVAVDLPEIKQFGNLVLKGKDRDSFLAHVETALSTPPSEDLIKKRQKFAGIQTWSHRVNSLIRLAESTAHDPLISLIIVTYNNLALTKECLNSIKTQTQYTNLEIIVVDNDSSDETPEFLTEWASSDDNHRIILNKENFGFAKANNQGLQVAKGEYLVLLNNDTYVTTGWVRTLMNHLKQNQNIGLIGPVTNNIGNEAKINIRYSDMEEMLKASSAYTRNHLGRILGMRTAAFFAVMIPRSVYESVGPLDEAFGTGFFEDDDYCRRIEEKGLTVACAEDVFIHHHLSASFNKLRAKQRQALFEKNKAIYEAKWGEWIPHKHRDPSVEESIPRAQITPPAPEFGLDESTSMDIENSPSESQYTRWLYPEHCTDKRYALNIIHGEQIRINTPISITKETQLFVRYAGAYPEVGAGMTLSISLSFAEASHDRPKTIILAVLPIPHGRQDHSWRSATIDLGWLAGCSGQISLSCLLEDASHPGNNCGIAVSDFCVAEKNRLSLVVSKSFESLRIKNEIAHFNTVYNHQMYNRKSNQPEDPPVETAFEVATSMLHNMIGRNRPDFKQRLIEKAASGKRVRVLSLCSGAARIEADMAAASGKNVEWSLLDINEALLESAAAQFPPSTKLNLLKENANNLSFTGETYDVVLCVSGMHHIVELEKFAEFIYASLNKGGEFWSIGEYVGRNGNRLWPKAYEEANRFFTRLPEKYRLNHHTGSVDKVIPDNDYSVGCFEGIRSQDIEPVLDQWFIQEDVYKVNCFLWRLMNLAYTDNYDLSRELDREWVKKAVDAEIQFFKKGGRGTELYGIYLPKVNKE